MLGVPAQHKSDCAHVFQTAANAPGRVALEVQWASDHEAN